MMKSLYIDSYYAGVSGNMFLGALLDMGGDKGKLEHMLKEGDKLFGSNSSISLNNVTKNGIASTFMDFEIENDLKIGDASRLWGEFQRFLTRLNPEEKVQEFARKTYRTILDAETRVHGEGPEFENLHLHELSSLDTFFDIIGSGLLLDSLGLFEDTRIISTPINLGQGEISISHGRFRVPLPVTLEILKEFKIPFETGPIEGELATPTGVAILANLADEFSSDMKNCRMESRGYGAGAWDFEGRANILRLILCNGPGDRLHESTVSVLETNLDDVSGELLGYLMERLFQEGALDVHIIPTITKKNRPGHMVSVIAGDSDGEKLTKVLMKETGTLGVRIYPATKRLCRKRELKEFEVKIKDRDFKIRVKTAIDDDYIISKKVEFDDAKKIAEELEMPLREVIRLIEGQIRT